MYSLKAVAYFLLIAALFSTAVLLNYWQILLYTIPLAIILWYSRTALPRGEYLFSIRREVSEETLIAGESLKVALVVENKSDREVTVEITDVLPPGVKVVKGSNTFFGKIGANDKLRIEYEVAFLRRGYYTLGPVKVVISDPFNLERRIVNIDIKAYVTVFPHFEPIKGFSIRPRYTGIWPGSITTRKSGLGSEFYSVREYLPGDDLRRINWKASARYGKLISNEYEGEKVTDVMLIVDTTGLETLGRVGLIALEAMISAAASLAHFLLNQGNRVGLLVHGYERAWVPPGFGRKQFKRILYYLAETRAGAHVLLDQILTYVLPHLLRPQAQVVILSPLLDTSILYALKSAVEREYSILVISPDPFSIPPQSFEEEIAFRIMSLKRENIIMKAREYSPVLDWKLTTSLSEALKRFRSVWAQPILRR